MAENQQINEQKNSTALEGQILNVKLNLARKSLAKGSPLGNFVSTVIFVLIAGAVITGNYFFEAKFTNGGSIEQIQINEVNYEETNILSGTAVLRFDDGDNFLQPKVALTQEGNSYFLDFEQGRMWGNFSISDIKVNILIDQVLLIPSNASFNLDFDGERIVLETYSGDVYVGFLNALYDFKELQDPYSDKFINRLLVPRDTQVEIPLKKVTDDIAPLLFTKLVKEFKYAAIPSGKREADWVLKNFREDSKFVESVKQKTISDVINAGANSKENVFSNFMFWAEENLTFVPAKRKQAALNRLFSYLDDAVFYFNTGKSAEGAASLKNFGDYLATLPEDASGEDFLNRLDLYVDKLTVFNPDDELYKVFTFLLEKREDPYTVVNRLWNYVYRGIDVSAIAAESALDNYYQRLDSTLGDLSDKNFYRMYLAYQNQLFDNLLLRYSLFYKDGYFAMKYSIEKNLLKLYEGQLLTELKQSFVSAKIDFMKRLRKFFFEEEISVHEAREIFSRLIEEANDMMPAESSAVAVIELFNEQLDDVDDFWGYLSSPEYHTNAYGLTHEERYESYLKERDTIYSFINLQEELLGEKVPVQDDVLSVIDSVEKTLKQNPDVAEVEILELTKTDQRYVPIKALIGGYPFEAKYDRDTDSLIEVYVYDELISDRAVKLDSLLSVLQEKFADLAGDFEILDDSGITLETSAERYARIYIAKKVGEYGFVADLENISVVDELNAVYRVNEVTMDGALGVVATFDILMNGEVVTNVLLMIDNKPQVLDGKYELEEFAAIVAGGELSSDVSPEGEAAGPRDGDRVLR